MELGRTALEREVDRAIDRIFAQKDHLTRFFKNHPRKQLFLDNLGKELYVAHNRAVLKAGPESLAKTILLMTKTFCQVALRHEQESMLSSAEKTRLREENERFQRAEDIVREAVPGMLSDDFRVKEVPHGQDEQ